MYPDDDTLTQSLYRLWQCLWFNQRFEQTGISAEQVFSLSDEQADTLAMKANKPYLAEVSRRMARVDASDTINGPLFWEQIKDILNAPASDYQAVEPASEKASETSVTAQDVLATLPPAIKLQWDTDTAYESKPLPSCTDSKTFDSHHAPHMYRLSVFDLHTTPEGGLTAISTGQGEYGLEAVNPGILPSNGTILLGSHQYYGLETLTGAPEQWLYLPSVTPHETIISLRTDPEKPFQVIKDRYTGLHMLHLPDVTFGEKVEVHYILESKKHSEKSRGTDDGGQSTRPDATCSLEIRREIKKILSPESLQSLPEAQCKELLAIDQASSDQDRVTAITDYCKGFRGTSDAPDENLLAFLLSEKQGACHHRTPVFVAFCRYYGIPARIVTSKFHSFPEYSLDDGQTWIAKDLGGAPVRLTVNTPAFRPTRPGVSMTTGNRRMNQTLKKMSPAQIAALAKILGLSPEEVARAIQSGTALPTQKKIPSNAEIVKLLWQEADQSCFTLGSELLKSKGELEYKEVLLAGFFLTKSSSMATAVTSSLHSGLSSDAVLQELLQLHAKLVDTDTMPLSDWQYSITQILQSACKRYGVSSPTVVTIARKALEQGWINPVKKNDFLAMPLHRLLKKLEAVDELKPLVTRVLQDWYNHFLGESRDIQDLEICSPSDVPEICGGSSPTLESSLKTVDLTALWTDEPEGIPDIERLLTHNPAFPVFSTGKTKPPPVIMMMGSYFWRETELNRKVKELFECYLENHPADNTLFEKENRRNEIRKKEREEINMLEKNYDYLDSKYHYRDFSRSPPRHSPPRRRPPSPDDSGILQSKINDVRKKYADLIVKEGCDLSFKDQYRLNEIERTYSKTIQRAFSHYLYQITNSKGGRLTFCWVDASQMTRPFGCHNPRSPEELIGCMENIRSSADSLKELDNTYLRQALKSHNGLVLKPEILTVAANEFLNTLDSKALYMEVTPA